MYLYYILVPSFFNTYILAKCNQFYYQKLGSVQVGEMSQVQVAGRKYKIGEGSFGKVYRYKYDNQQYAVKKIYKDTKNHPQLAQKMQAQGRIMQKVGNHRNVVGFLGEMTKGKHIYLLTQLVPHGDLRQIKSVPCEDDIWEIVMQLAMVLLHLRKNNIIHRDIKPENILIKQIHEQGKQTQVILKLTDFGLAEMVEDGRNIQGIAGSPIYLAPEMCSHRPYSYEVDMWSMGITMYQLVNEQRSPYQQDILDYMATHPNFTQKQLFNYLTNLIQTKIIKCQSQYTDINAVIEGMLKQDPNNRVTPFQLLRHPQVMGRIIKFNQSRRNQMKMGSISTKAQFNQEYMQNKQNKSRSNSSSQSPQSADKTDANLQLGYSPSRREQSLLYLSSRLSRSIVSELNQTESSVQVEKQQELISIRQ